MCLLCSRVYASSAHLNRKLNYRRLDKKQQRSIWNRACWERAPNNDVLACVQDWCEFVCGGPPNEKRGQLHVAHSRSCCQCNCYNGRVREANRKTINFLWRLFVGASTTNWFWNESVIFVTMVRHCDLLSSIGVSARCFEACGRWQLWAFFARLWTRSRLKLTRCVFQLGRKTLISIIFNINRQ